MVFEAWKIDDWFGEDYIVKVDGVSVWERTFGFGDPGLADICGGDGFENFAVVDFVIGHETETLDFLIQNTIGSSNNSGTMALRNFKLYYEKPDTCATLYTQCNYTGILNYYIQVNHSICVKTLTISNCVNIQVKLNQFKCQLVQK